MKSWKKPTANLIEKALSSAKKEIDRQYFFSRLRNPYWLSTLREKGYFKSPPPIVNLQDGVVQYPNWPEMSYLVNVCEDAPREVLNIIKGLPASDNPRIYDYIIDIALKLHGENSSLLFDKIYYYIKEVGLHDGYNLAQLLSHWVEEEQITVAAQLAVELVRFRPDPNYDRKFKQRKEHPDDWTNYLEPAPIFKAWEYKRLLNVGVLKLAEKSPLQTSLMLANELARAIKLSRFKDSDYKIPYDDLSEYWCPRLAETETHYSEPKVELVYTLVKTSIEVYNRCSDADIEILDAMLGKQAWDIFKRIRLYLYAEFPSEFTLPKIRKAILERERHDRRLYKFEFQRMVRKSCEHFGDKLFTQDELSRIFTSVLKGLSREDYKKNLDNEITEEEFDKKNRLFKYKQLKSYVRVLFGKYFELYKKYAAEFKDFEITDDTYMPVGEVKTGWIKSISPLKSSQMEMMDEHELLKYINNWEDTRHDSVDWLIEYNIEALAVEFANKYFVSIYDNRNRLGFWFDHYVEIQRPIYIRHLIKSFIEHIRQNKILYLAEYLAICDAMLKYRYDSYYICDNRYKGESRQFPHWISVRWSIIDLLNECFNNKFDISDSVKAQIKKIIYQLCISQDPELDNSAYNHEKYTDYLTAGLNCLRSSAVRILFKYAYWLRETYEDNQLLDFWDCVDARFNLISEMPLSLPEYAMWGKRIRELHAFSSERYNRIKQNLLPQDNLEAWGISMSSYVQFNIPTESFYGEIKSEIGNAINRMSDLKPLAYGDADVIVDLGFHLFVYYLLGNYSISEDSNYLASYYNGSEITKKCLKKLFSRIGHALRNHSEKINDDQIQRIYAFYNWRLRANSPEELKGFVNWIDIPCLEPEWRLSQLSLIIGMCGDSDLDVDFDLKPLNDMLEEHPAQVVECFAKLTDTINEKNSWHILFDESAQIIRIGLTSSDFSIKKDAARARENLLRLGRFEYLDI